MKTYKITKLGNEARKKLKAGVDFVGDVVKQTLGGTGGNVIIESKYSSPIVVNDGFRVAREIHLRDEIEDMGAQSLVGVAEKTDQEVGDGTTTSMVLARAIVDEVMKDIDEEPNMIKSNVNLRSVYNEINEACKKVVVQLNKMATPIKTKAEIKKVALVACEDEKLAEMIAEMYDKLGKDGFISIDDSYGMAIEQDISMGMKFNASPAAAFMITDPGKKRMEIIKELPLLITNCKIDSILDILRNPINADGIFMDLVNKKEPGVIVMAPHFGEPVLKTFYKNSEKTNFKMFAVKVPSLTTDQLEDIAVYTGANLIDAAKGGDLKKTTLEDLGSISRMIVDDDYGVILGEPKNKQIVENRLLELKEQLKTEVGENFKNMMKRRISSLSGGIGVIKVGARTDTEKTYIRLKLEDAVGSCKAAMEEGVIPGGGMALKMIAEKLPKSILTEALKAPYEQIKENCGGKLEIGEDVIDAKKVIKTALENACSMASILTTTGVAIATPRSDLEDDLMTWLTENR